MARRVTPPDEAARAISVGLTPLPAYRPPTRIEQAKSAYVRGILTFEEFEAHVTQLLASRTADERTYPQPLKPAIPTYRLR